jgi:Transposase DNA-binding/Transposase DDE domain
MARMGIEKEFENAPLGDARLSARLPKLAQKLAAKPDVSFPKALDASELEALYRFVGNDDVSPAAILAPHVAATVRRCVKAKLALVAHDTTEFGYSTSREGMGRVTDEGTGFFAHFSLAVASDGLRDPLGVLNLQTHTRTGKPKRKSGRHTEMRPPADRESFRWQEGVDAAEDAVAGQAPIVHLMDREADSFSLFAHMVARNARFVVRIRANRKLGETEKLFEHMSEMKHVITREVPISARSKQSSGGSRKVHPLRSARPATLHFAAGEIRLPVPTPRPKTEGRLPDELVLRVVHVREKTPPAGCEPIDWKLITTEPIGKPSDIEAVVDFYRARWLVEEFFKALKSGCAMEKRQLESLDAMLNALAIFTPVAVEMLKLRYISRHAPNVSADQVLRPLQLKILAKKLRVQIPASALDAMLAVARLGGHLKRNGPPGWMVLGRGYTELLALEEGARIALNL